MQLKIKIKKLPQFSKHGHECKENALTEAELHLENNERKKTTKTIQYRI
jgi:hypothetical protein